MYLWCCHFFCLRWESVSGVLGPYDRPVVLNRASSTNTTNPFGSTFCYGYQDIIFEVSTSQYSASRIQMISRVFSSKSFIGKKVGTEGS